MTPDQPKQPNWNSAVTLEDSLRMQITMAPLISEINACNDIEALKVQFIELLKLFHGQKILVKHMASQELSAYQDFLIDSQDNPGQP